MKGKCLTREHWTIRDVYKWNQNFQTTLPLLLEESKHWAEQNELNNNPKPRLSIPCNDIIACFSFFFFSLRFPLFIFSSNFSLSHSTRQFTLNSIILKGHGGLLDRASDPHGAKISEFDPAQGREEFFRGDITHLTWKRQVLFLLRKAAWYLNKNLLLNMYVCHQFLQYFILYQRE